jgi:RecA/RadA recombinase
MPAGPLPARNALPKVPIASPPSPGLRPTARPSRERIAALLGDLSGQLKPGHTLQSSQEPEADRRRHPSGLDAIDELLGGGFARGDLGEITGPASSGRTSLLFALLASTTTGGVENGGGQSLDGRRGELAALVDPGDAFDPGSAQAAGVDLRRVLWARVGPGRDALRCTERLLETEGLPFVILDLAPGAAPSARSPGEPEIPTSAWTRLARRAAANRTALVVLSHQRRAGSQARIVLELQPARAHFSGCPPLLEKIETRAVLVRHPSGGHGRSALVRLGGSFRAPPPPG